MTETVCWIGVVEKLYAAGVRTFVEVGPGKVLSGLVKKIAKDVDTFQVSSPEGVERLKEASLV